ncbi:MAG: hypothetical protein QG656_2552, partial [Candidatus Hydrogenedentes bacterium]|nr:hypothetical protein [Candidatus Hydrogenedentota bacterium]
MSVLRSAGWVLGRIPSLSRKGMGLLFICWLCTGFLVFAFIGLSNWVNCWRSSDWVAMKGTIAHLNAEFYESRGERNEPESERCRRVECEYTYEVAGVTYRNNRIGLETFTDNGSAHEAYRRYLILKEVQDAGQPVDVWVDPDDP